MPSLRLAIAIAAIAVTALKLTQHHSLALSTEALAQVNEQSQQQTSERHQFVLVTSEEAPGSSFVYLLVGLLGVRVVWALGDGPVAWAQLQSELMAFTDTYMAVLAQAADQFMLDAETMDDRRLASGMKVSGSGNAVEIASRANPVIALLDMTVMVSIQRLEIEERTRR